MRIVRNGKLYYEIVQIFVLRTDRNNGEKLRKLKEAINLF